MRDNEIAHCEQAGIVGSLGAIFSRITGNDIHDIHVRRLFTGAEMAGIKIHAAVDTEIRGNHIYRTHRGIWLDWMAQGARVTRNLLHDNDGTQDLFFEVNHGPFMVDHNICLSVYPDAGESHWQSRRSVLDVSQGGAYAHNLFANGVRFHNELTRDTPYLEAHGTPRGGPGEHPRRRQPVLRQRPRPPRPRGLRRGGNALADEGQRVPGGRPTVEGGPVAGAAGRVRSRARADREAGRRCTSR